MKEVAKHNKKVLCEWCQAILAPKSVDHFVVLHVFEAACADARDLLIVPDSLFKTWDQKLSSRVDPFV